MRNSVLNDIKVEAVLDRLYYNADRQLNQLLWHYLPQLLTGKGSKWNTSNTSFYNDKYIPIESEQGDFLYLLARSNNAKTIVEFGTSFGISTLYLATAIRDNGGGLVIGTEIVPEKIRQAKANITQAGLDNYVEIREGNALETLQNLNLTVDLLLIDGWPNLALDVLKMVDPFIRKGGIVVSDNIGTFKEELKPYVKFLQDRSNGYCSTTLNLRGGTEFSVKV